MHDPAVAGGLQPPETGIRLFRLLECLPAAAYLCDADGLITYFNRHAVSVWGRSPRLHHPDDRYCGSFVLRSPDGELIRHEDCWMALALRDRQEYAGREIVIERADGSSVPVLAYASPLHAEDGSLAGAVNILVDISEQRELQDRLREADRRKEEFLAALSHELRNPIGPIRNVVEAFVARRTFEDGERDHLVGVLARQVDHLVRLVDDLLDLSRINSRNLELRREIVELRSVVDFAVEVNREELDAAGHRLAVALPSAPIQMVADRTRLGQVVGNLLSNAVRYTPPGGSIVIRGETAGDEVVISVSDDGVGIAAGMLSRIFEPFHSGVGSAHGGLGLGLGIARHLTELHGGTLEAYSDGPGRGSVFTVRLPLRAAVDAEGATGASEAGSAPGTRTEPGRERKTETKSAADENRPTRVLVVDDNRDAADVLALGLEKRGFDARVAYDGESALSAIEREDPHVALLDIDLPDMNGFEIARQVRRDRGDDIELVAVTGWGNERDREYAMEAGFDHHFTKPVRLSQLVDYLQALGTGGASVGPAPDDASGNTPS